MRYGDDENSTSRISSVFEIVKNRGIFQIRGLALQSFFLLYVYNRVVPFRISLVVYRNLCIVKHEFVEIRQFLSIPPMMGSQAYLARFARDICL